LLPLGDDEFEHLLVVLLLFGIPFLLHEGGSLAVEQLEPGEMLDDAPEEGYLLLGAGVVLER
jgi:hypothetical protein